VPDGINSVSDAERHYSWGIWDVILNPDDLTVTAIPHRAGDAHWNVTSLIDPDNCAGCLTFSDLEFIDSDSIKITVSISHPYSGNPALNGFDVKGVVLGPPALTMKSGTVSTLVENPDGFTHRWAFEPWANINPYIDFAVESEDRKFASGETHSRDFIIQLPEVGPLQFIYIIDACWLPPPQVDPGNPYLSNHCNEAYDVDVKVSGNINAIAGSMAEITVEFSDWQSDGNAAVVICDAPALLNNPIELTHTGKANPYSFTGFINNEKNVSSGTYDLLVNIHDTINNPENNSLTTSALTSITVTSETPALSGIEIHPDTVSLSDLGSNAQFTVYKKYSDGSKTICADNADWFVTGTDLNGNNLTEISAGTITRATSKWWGGIAVVEAQWSTYTAFATAICDDPFADTCEVIFGELNEEGSDYTLPSSFAGPPNGAGGGSGGLKVCSLGYGGIATLEFTDNVAMNGGGIDLLIFENPMIVGAPCETGGQTYLTIWNENAAVEVSMDGVEWHRFPTDYNPDNQTCVANPWMDPSSYSGLAGNYPVYAGVDDTGVLKNGIDPTDPVTAGGDGFDLDDVGLPWCRYVRIIDCGDPDWPSTHMLDDDGDAIYNYGNMSPLGSTENMAGFDGDSIAACHSEPINTVL